ncbi:MAG TPA: DNA primase, partial [Acidimicrobiales bacterium]|nr:DNA primase [Acidimicrobiales bacterium]
MAISDEDVARVRAATDIVALIGEHAGLRRQGRRFVGLCPFHPEKTPSFSVNAEEGLYYCFGCQASGDAISYVRAVEHLDFADAVRYLAERAGITIQEDAAGGAERRRRAELLEAMEKAVAWYHERLVSGPDAGAARTYLRSRGYDGDTVRAFRLGWAPDDWDALSRSLGVPERSLTGAGLGFVNRRGRLQDAFRARVIFPICDPAGRPVALGGRILPPGPGAEPGAAGPKYKNSAETPIYSKRRTLYALNWAKHDVVATEEVIVCEGYTDVIGCFQAGLPRAVATCGTALGEEHFTLLRNFAKRIVLAYDADAAGQSATSRVYEWERRHEVDVAVAALPPGTDPGELARTDPEALRTAVSTARPFLQFRVDRVLGAADLSTAEGRARAADLALAAVAEHPADLVRDQYVMQVADRCRLDPDLMRRHLAEARRRVTDGGAPSPGRGSGRPGAERERPARTDPAPEEPTPPAGGRPGRAGAATGRPGLEALRLAVHCPEAVDDRLEEVLFDDELQRATFAALAGAESLHEAVESAPPDVADLLRRLAVEEPVLSGDALGDPVDAVVAQLTRTAARRALADLQAEARTSPGQLGRAAAEAAQVRRWLEDLDHPESGRAASDRLL